MILRHLSKSVGSNTAGKIQRHGDTKTQRRTYEVPPRTSSADATGPFSAPITPHCNGIHSRYSSFEVPYPRHSHPCPCPAAGKRFLNDPGQPRKRKGCGQTAGVEGSSCIQGTSGHVRVRGVWGQRRDMEGVFGGPQHSHSTDGPAATLPP